MKRVLLAAITSIACACFPGTRAVRSRADLPIDVQYPRFFNHLKYTVSTNWHPVDVLRRRDPTHMALGYKDRTTILHVTVLPDGALKDLQVKTSSGADVLDVEAMEAFRRSAPFKEPPAELRAANGEASFDFGFRIAYRQRAELPDMSERDATPEIARVGDVDEYFRQLYAAAMDRVAADPRIATVPPSSQCGLMQIRYTLRIDGTILDASIVQTSGNAIFDTIVVNGFKGTTLRVPAPDALFDARGYFIGLFSYRIDAAADAVQ